MRTTLLAGVSAAILAASPAWVARPTLPGDRFQLAEGGNSTLQRKAEGNGTTTRITEGNGTQARIA
jgi:hypothetical protein